MTVAIATAGGVAVWMLVMAVHRRRLVDRLAPYLEGTANGPVSKIPGILERVAPSVPWVVVGGTIGVLLAQGDLFIAGPGRSTAGLGLLGAVGGWFIHSAVLSTVRERRERRYRYELPVVTDTIALQIVSGESVPSALSHIVAGGSGVATEEIEAAVDRFRTIGVEDSLLLAARTAVDPSGRRLYETLAHSHAFGGRVGESLSSLATDYRASLERDLTAKGGRKAVTTFGPVLALMVPTALLFLLYPTLLGLRALSGAP